MVIFRHDATALVSTVPCGRRNVNNITLSADDDLIGAARERARREHTNLNKEFRRWLEDYVRPEERMARYYAAVAEVQGKMRVWRKLTRDEMNER